ncbi:MAG: Mur ligase domain-containing protein, partial [Clostridia bacterium]|nr:Mur ligase domain-containing protein [Clostridia bacterium]
MKENVLKENKRVLLLGIGGVSMHQLALCYLNEGYKVVGYDRAENEYTTNCFKHGIVVFNKFNKAGLDVDFCVKTAAVKDNNKFVVELKKRGIKIVDRAEALGYFAAKFKCVVAVAGTHGKSTTSALIYEMLRQANFSVSCHIGADVFAPRFNTKDDVLVVEACEYNKSFLSLYPTVSVVTNVEPEHLDCYGSFFALKSAFATFLRRGKKRFVFKGKTTQFLGKINDVNFVEKTQN